MRWFIVAALGFLVVRSGQAQVCDWQTPGTTIQAACNVGIGGAPTYAFEIFSNGSPVMGPASLVAAMSSPSRDRGLLFGFEGIATGVIAAATTAATPSTLKFFTWDGAYWRNRFQIDGAGRVGIGTTTPYAALDVQSASDVSTFPGSPITAALRDSNPYSTPNAGAGLAFNAAFNAAGETTAIGVLAAVKESNVDGHYAGALTFMTRVYPSGSAAQERMRITSTGRVGIGTSTPATQLHVKAAGNAGVTVEGSAGSSPLIQLNQLGDTKWYIQHNAGGYAEYRATGTHYFAGGNVGIGTTAPTQRLHVEGNIHVSGNINAKYQDVAEWVPAATDLAPGTVVVLDRAGPNLVRQSEISYDITVAGVVSEQPGIVLGEAGPGKVQVATTGRVLVNVDARGAPIRIGDLLVSSDIAGAAMRSDPTLINGRQFHQPGTIIGKALQPLESGLGQVLVLLSLQ